MIWKKNDSSWHLAKKFQNHKKCYCQKAAWSWLKKHKQQSMVRAFAAWCIYDGHGSAQQNDRFYRGKLSLQIIEAWYAICYNWHVDTHNTFSTSSHRCHCLLTWAVTSCRDDNSGTDALTLKRLERRRSLRFWVGVPLGVGLLSPGSDRSWHG